MQVFIALKIGNDITNAYVEKGYITSRALLEPQDISQGILRIRVIEGKVESIEPDARSSMQPRQFLTIFPFVRGSVLNLRDIEQGLDQLNRLPSNRAAMRIEPGGAPGASRVLVSNIQERTWRPFAGFDNLGQDTSGRAQYTLGLEKDNFLMWPLVKPRVPKIFLPFRAGASSAREWAVQSPSEGATCTRLRFFFQNFSTNSPDFLLSVSYTRLERKVPFGTKGFLQDCAIYRRCKTTKIARTSPDSPVIR